MTEPKLSAWLLALLLCLATATMARSGPKNALSIALISESVAFEPGSPTSADTSGCPQKIDSIPAIANKKSRESVLELARACVGERKLALAVALLTQVIRKDPAYAVVYLNRGSAYGDLGEFARAVNDFTTAISLQPDLAEAWYNRGAALLRMRRFSNAIVNFTEAIRLKPRLAAAYCNRGLANVQLGEYDDALADFTTAIDKQPGFTFCYFNRGSLYLVLGEFQRAISDLTETLGDAKSKGMALSRRGQAYEALGQHTPALDDFRAALKIDPNLDSAKEGFSRLTKQQATGIPSSPNPPFNR